MLLRVPGAELKRGHLAMGGVWGEAPNKAGQGQSGALGPAQQPHEAQQLTFVLVYARDLLRKDVLSMTAFSGKIANLCILLPFVKRGHPSFHSLYEE